MDPDRHQQLSDALLRALEMDEVEQQQFLSELQADDPEMAAEVAALLSVDEEVKTSFLAAGPVPGHLLDDTSATASAGAENDPFESLPAVIGPYQLQELLGEGGMGRVFLAKQEEPLRRTVALKLLSSALADDWAKAHFESEAQVLAQLEHPNIGRILDAGTTEDGFPFFAMELVEGEPITDYCNRCRLTIRERLEIMLQVCRGVEHAHRKQIIHRDLKPSNILVAEIDGRPVAKIIDFGIARSIAQTGAGGDRSAKVEGTPAYMSPEAIHGSSDLDTRTDVYSLGVLLYLILAGSRPFRGGTLETLVRQVLNEDPPRASTQLRAAADKETGTQVARQRGLTVSSLRRRLRGELDWILQTAVARDREDRYGSVAALAEDLRRYIQRRRVKAHPPTPTYLLNKWLYRYRVPLVLAGLVGVSGVSFLVQDAKARARAERLAQAGLEVARQVEGAQWQLRVIHMLPEHDITAQVQMIRDDLEAFEKKIPEMYLDAEGEAQYALGRGALSLGNFAAARTALEKAWQLGNRRPEVAGALGLTLGRLYEQRLSAIRLVPDPQERPRLRKQAAEELLDRAMPLLEQAQDVPGSSELGQARLAYYRRDHQRALELSRGLATTFPWIFEARFLEAEILQEQAFELVEGDDVPDWQLLEQAVAVVEKGLAVAPSSPQGLLLQCQLRRQQVGVALNRREHDAGAAHGVAVEICRRAQRVQPSLLRAYLVEGQSWGDLADHHLWDLNRAPAEALKHQRQLLGKVLEEPSVAPFLAAQALLTLGQGFRLQARFDELSGVDPGPSSEASIEHLKRALELQPDFASVSADLAFTYGLWANYVQNRGGDARELLAQATLFARRAWQIDPDDDRAACYLAQCLVLQGISESKRGQDPVRLMSEAEQLSLQVLEHSPNMLAAQGGLINSQLMWSKWKVRSGEDPTESLLTAERVSKEILAFRGKAPFSNFTAGHSRIELARFEAMQGRDPWPHARLAREMYPVGLESINNLAGPYVELADLALVLARYEYRQGRSPVSEVEEAVRRTTQAIEMDPGRHDAKRMRAEAEALGQTWRRRQGATVSIDRPLSQLRQVVADDPTAADHHLALAQVIYDWWSVVNGEANSEWPGEALQASRQALRLNPSIAQALALEGAILAAVGEPEQGVEKLRQAIDRNSNLSLIWQPLIDSLTEPPEKAAGQSGH